MGGSGRRQRWYAIAEPIRGVYDSYERCQTDLVGVRGTRRGPVEVSSEDEGWAVLNGGVRLDAGLYVFTDATANGGVGVVVVRMPVAENADPQILEPACSSSVVQILDAKPIAGIDSAQAVEALGRLRNILAEMVALYEALNQLLVREDVVAGSEITIVHDYFGVSAWMQAGAPPDAAMRIDPGYYEASFKKHAWAPAKDPTISAVIAACWELVSRKQLLLVFRHQPGHRSEAAGIHHFVRFNKMADELADQGSGRPSSATS
ncbi:MAG: hypothetical protein M3456_02495 [Actinomycetota bacterium]|nr:hypothetical protein [Actinomycetota bacterium]